MSIDAPARTGRGEIEPANVNTRRSSGFLGGVSHVVLFVWAVLIVVPIIWIFVSSFKSNTELFTNAWSIPGQLRTGNWSRAFSEGNIGRFFLNTILVVAAGTFGTMVLGSMAAYVLARYPFRGARFIYFVFVAGLAFPVFLALTPLFFVVRNIGQIPGIGQFIGLDSYGGVILVYIAYSLPFTVFFLTAFFRTLPTPVAEAAVIDGCSNTRLFFRVMMPMAKPGLISITIFNVVGQWNQYLLPLVLLSGQAKDKWVLTQGIADIAISSSYRADWPALFAALSMAILPMIIVYVLFQRHIQAGLTAGAVK
ncbi:carbohydrate ABC transporter permease [Sciscionella marina]|uniref:carbohydrate ABC transporter permease n=1 Tax=Sciscionella marina TaxID=508770 RepID=UPI000375D01A|nr:carbohydrate ABC transporter permease [Sciscionella marina]